MGGKVPTCPVMAAKRKPTSAAKKLVSEDFLGAIFS